jgi:hypothetical protein
MSGLKIAVLQRGWVVLGDIKKEGDTNKVENAKVIRRWGTTKGLGEIAKNGPTSSTVLDDAGTVQFHQNQLIFTIDTDEKLWNK